MHRVATNGNAFHSTLSLLTEWE